MMKLEPELIDMNDYEESGDGFCAISYNHRNGKTMIKLYNDFVDRSVSDDEIRESQAVLEMGILPQPLTFGAVFTSRKLVPKRVEFLNILHKVQVIELVIST